MGLVRGFKSLINGNSEEIKKAKKMSLLTHAALMLLVVVSFKFGLLITSISLIAPVVFAGLSLLLVKSGEIKSNQNSRLLDCVDIMIFSAHFLLLAFIRFMPLYVSHPIMILNLMVSAKYVARIIEVAYDSVDHSMVSIRISALQAEGIIRTDADKVMYRIIEAAPQFTSEQIADTSLFA